MLRLVQGCGESLLFVLSHLKKDVMKRIAIVSRIEKGLGDVGWAMRLESLAMRARLGDVVVVLYNAKELQIEHIQRLRAASLIDRVEDVSGSNGTYVLARMIGDEEMEKLKEMFDLVVGFNYHPFSIRRNLSGDVIHVNEYGYGENDGRMMFRDFEEAYGDIVVDSDGCCRTEASPLEFQMALDGRGREAYRSEYMGKVVPREKYYFTYFSTKDDAMGMSNVDIMRETCRWIRRFGGGDEMVVMTNVVLERGCSGVEVTDGSESFVCNVYFRSDGIRVRVFRYEGLTSEEFEYALLRSERVAGCTGDMSLTQVLSSGRLFVYLVFEHKRRLVSNLKRTWMSVGGEEGELAFINDRPRTVSVDAGMGARSGLEKRYRAFLNRLREDGFERWFVSKAKQLLCRDSGSTGSGGSPGHH